MAAEVSSSDRRAADPGSGSPGGEAVARPVRRPRLWLKGLVTSLLLMTGLAASGWAAARYTGVLAPARRGDLETAVVRRGELALILNEEGNLESASNIDIKCEMVGGSVILWIVDDGTQVHRGEKLVELDASDLEERLNQQRIAYEKARAAMVESEKDFAAAQTAVQEYLDGTFVQERLAAENQITIANENLRSSQNALDHSERMFRKGYISALDLASQRFSVERAKLELDSAQTAKDVLVRFTKEKMLQELTSRRDAAEAQVAAQEASFALEESRLKRLEEQLPKAVITAPAEGMVVYANERDRRGMQQQPQIEIGASVRERQTILRLPDLRRMQARIVVHESRVEPLGRALAQAQLAGRELPVRIEVQGQFLRGRLVSIANQPIPPDWRTGFVKQYPCIVSIEDAPQGLRPGMTARCELLVDRKPNVLMMPVLAVLEQEGKVVCWTVTARGIERRQLLLGLSNGQMVEVVDGVTEGETVVLNPRATIPQARRPTAPATGTPPSQESAPPVAS